MVTYRNPVDGGLVSPSLQCIDIDPVTGKRIGSACKDRWSVYQGSSFDCPNKGNGCSGGAFLYPRKPRPSGKGFHFHQGVDIGWTAGAVIRSVTAGRVVVAVDKYEGSWNFYGQIVIVRSDQPGNLPGPLYFLYAHCDSICVNVGDTVAEYQQIGTTGSTWYHSGNPTAHFPGKPHLHFEVVPSLKSMAKETQLGEDQTRTGEWNQPRLDPLWVLQQLGPWGMTKVFYPNDRQITPDVAEVLHGLVESSNQGGYFPLGANNHWHGGVHAPSVGRVVAPCDATIVAVRLDPNPASAHHKGNDTNFILLRHEIPMAAYRLFQGEDPSDVVPTVTDKTRSVGRRQHCANLPDDVCTVKHRLHEHIAHNGVPYYHPPDLSALDSPEVTDNLKRAIKAFQEEVLGKSRPDGVVDIPGSTWAALHDGRPPEEPPPPPPKANVIDSRRVFYTLLMHMAALPLNRTTVEAFPWLSTVRLPSSGFEPSEEEAKRVRKEREEDEVEADHKMAGSVGAATEVGEPATNLPDDVEWVAKRLIRFGYLHREPMKVCDQDLVDAIVDFQNEHHPTFKKNKSGDGRVDTYGDTATLLHRSRGSLRGEKAPVIDPVFADRCAQRHSNGVAKVVSGLDIPVRSGEPLWRAGRLLAYGPDGRSVVPTDAFHWEVFSPDLIGTKWDPVLEDASEDLIADVPERLLDRVEGDAPGLVRDHLLTPAEVAAFYQSGKAEFLRRTPCRFVSHWGLDVGSAVARLADMHFDTAGVADALRPLMFWSEAADVLPASQYVYHYNPISFFAEYGRILDILHPEQRDPATHPTLVVRVVYRDGTPMPDAKVRVLLEGKVERTGSTDDSGEARFHGMVVGVYGVQLVDPVVVDGFVEVVPNTQAEITIGADVAPPPPPKGNLRVRVRQYTYHTAGDGIEVWITPVPVGDFFEDATENGVVDFLNIPYGKYTIEAGEAPPKEVDFHAAKKTVEVVLPPPMRTLHLVVLVDGAPGANLPFTVKGDHGSAAGNTSPNGEAFVEIPEGRYKVRVGDVTKGVLVTAKSEPYTVKLDEPDAPEPDAGGLVVTVTDEEGEPATTASVVVRDPGFADGRYPDGNGVASFKVPAGEYHVEVDGEERGHARVLPAKTTWVKVDLGDVGLA